MLKIAKMNVMPPGGYQYVQPETKMQFNGNTQFKSQLKSILAHRKGNHLPGATLDAVAQDLVAYTCARVPGVCVEASATIVTRLGVTAAVSGTEVTVTRQAGKCGSCGGRKRQ